MSEETGLVWIGQDKKIHLHTHERGISTIALEEVLERPLKVQALTFVPGEIAFKFQAQNEEKEFLEYALTRKEDVVYTHGEDFRYVQLNNYTVIGFRYPSDEHNVYDGKGRKVFSTTEFHSIIDTIDYDFLVMGPPTIDGPNPLYLMPFDEDDVPDGGYLLSDMDTDLVLVADREVYGALYTAFPDLVRMVDGRMRFPLPTMRRIDDTREQGIFRYQNKGLPMDPEDFIRVHYAGQQIAAEVDEDMVDLLYKTLFSEKFAKHQSFD